MQDRARRDLGAEVVGGLAEEEPVGRVQERGADRVHRVQHLGRRRDRGIDRGGDDQHHERGREQPPEPPGVEASEPDRSRGTNVAQQHLGDEVPREDEEDVDADVAALEPVDTGMESEDEVDGNRPEAVEVWPVARP